MSETLTDKQYADLKNILEIQGNPGNWAVDDYMRGLYNGLEMATAIVEDRAPVFKSYTEALEALSSGDGLEVNKGSAANPLQEEGK